MKTKQIVAATMLLFVSAFTACKKDDDKAPELTKPVIEGIEIGLNNNEIGVIDQDFHFNADITAGDKIDVVEIKILQKTGETYSKTWSHTVTWTQYKGSKNTNVHKHFSIPTEAAEGKYDFIITVTDENGTKLEEKRNITIYAAGNIPVNPTASIFNIMVNDDNSFFYTKGSFKEAGSSLKKGDKFNSQITISGVKGSGKMYILLINKKHNHRPESIDQIDFTKAIVYDVFEHKDEANTFDFTNTPADFSTNPFTVRRWPDLTIGGTTDNNVPATPINGTKAWETGTYYYGVVYLNTTHNISFHKYIEIPLNMN